MVPIPGVGTIIPARNDEKEILLMYRTKECEFYPDCWFIPCGRAEKGEKPISAAVREAREETSLETEVLAQISYKINEKGIPEIAYLCRIISGTPIIMEPDKCKRLDFFRLNKLPKNVDKRALEILKEYQEYLLQPY